jgi:CTP:molybdopterin cytidylyltransferase MocA
VITGLVLAAGAGRRLGQPKAELVLGGSRLIDRAVMLLSAGGCREVVAVVRSADLVVAGARSVLNPNPDDGMGSSLCLGLAAIDAEACVIVLVDQIGISPAEVAAAIESYRAGAQIVVARRAGMRSHPVLVSRPWFDDFGSAAVGDQGGRSFIDQHPGRVRYLDLSAEITDIDTAEDLAELNDRVQPLPAPPAPSERSRPEE